MNIWSQAFWILKAETRLVARSQTAAFGRLSLLIGPLTFFTVYLLLCTAMWIALSVPINIVQNSALQTGVFLVTLGLLVMSLIPAIRELILGAPRLTLILTSPFPLTAYLIARIYALAIRSSLLPILLITPIFAIAALDGQPRALFSYLFIILVAVVVSSAFVAILIIFHSLLRSDWIVYGVRATGLVLTGSIFFWVNSLQFGADNWLKLQNALMGKYLNWFASGVIGNASTMIFFVACAIVTPILAARFCSTPLTRTLIPRVSNSVGRNKSIPKQFPSSLFTVVLRKEARLCYRSPGIYVQFLRVCIATAIGFGFFARNGLIIGMLGPAMLVICHFLANELSWSIARTEQAQALLDTSPTAPHLLQVFKAVIAAVLPLACVVVAAVTVAQIDLRYGIFSGVVCAIAVVLCVIVNVHVAKGVAMSDGLSEDRRQPVPIVLAQGAIATLSMLIFYFGT